MKEYFLKGIAWVLDAISLVICLPGAFLIMIGGLLSDWSDSIKHL